MNLKVLIVIFFCLPLMTIGQIFEKPNKNPKTQTMAITSPSTHQVLKFKDSLDLKPEIVSVEFKDKNIRLNKSFRFNIHFESAYINVHDSLFIKVYLSRNKEDGQLYYGMRWGYFIEKKLAFLRFAKSNYIETIYNYDLDKQKYTTPNSFSIGNKDVAGYFKINYFYQLQ